VLFERKLADNSCQEIVAILLCLWAVSIVRQLNSFVVERR
jgi:hypothetical protein